jgi:hypothetical protein
MNLMPSAAGFNPLKSFSSGALTRSFVEPTRPVQKPVFESIQPEAKSFLPVSMYQSKAMARNIQFGACIMCVAMPVMNALVENIQTLSEGQGYSSGEGTDKIAAITGANASEIGKKTNHAQRTRLTPVHDKFSRALEIASFDRKNGGASASKLELPLSKVYETVRQGLLAYQPAPKIQKLEKQDVFPPLPFPLVPTSSLATGGDSLPYKTLQITHFLNGQLPIGLWYVALKEISPEPDQTRNSLVMTSVRELPTLENAGIALAGINNVLANVVANTPGFQPTLISRAEKSPEPERFQDIILMVQDGQTDVKDFVKKELTTRLGIPVEKLEKAALSPGVKSVYKQVYADHFEPVTIYRIPVEKLLEKLGNTSNFQSAMNKLQNESMN